MKQMFVYVKDDIFSTKERDEPEEHCLGRLIKNKDFIAVVSVNPLMNEHGFFVEGDDVTNFDLQNFMTDFVKLIGIQTLKGTIKYEI